MEPTEPRQDTAARLLRLLGLLQSRPEWVGTELAGRLGVTTRTVRRDIDRLRGLDYVIDSTRGAAGGYRLRAGRTLPPLALDDDEAVAVAAGLVTSALGSITGIEDRSMRALVKLERMLPARLRRRLSSVVNATETVPRHATPRVDPSVVATLALCCTEREIATFEYRDRAGRTSGRRTEPHSLVTLEGLWYLVGFDVDRAGWRTYRVDRIGEPSSTRHRFAPRDLPAADPAEYLVRSLARAPYRYTAVLRIGMSAAAVRAGLFRPLPGHVTEDGPAGCTVRLSAETPELVAQYVASIAALGAELDLDAPEAVRSRVRAVGALLRSV
ncbi:helix-turn-helix transcriptional regulator [Saccharomonospora piscinae]|uniref:helix-turn-helix transcriptional regulator n=1 Tax=Saccharomonospora piscinae TaxID=687388 RepID=UPI001FC9258C|nr:WYL domain-containing protein [Saccharomonospora piscinae]